MPKGKAATPASPSTRRKQLARSAVEQPTSAEARTSAAAAAPKSASRGGETNTVSKHAQLIAAGFTPPKRGTGKPLKRPSGTKSTIAASMPETNNTGASEGSKLEKPVQKNKTASKSAKNIDSKDVNESVASKSVAGKKAALAAATPPSVRKVRLRTSSKPKKSVLESVGDEDLTVSSATSSLHLEGDQPAAPVEKPSCRKKPKGEPQLLSSQPLREKPHKASTAPDSTDASKKKSSLAKDDTVAQQPRLKKSNAPAATLRQTATGATGREAEDKLATGAKEVSSLVSSTKSDAEKQRNELKKAPVEQDLDVGVGDEGSVMTEQKSPIDLAGNEKESGILSLSAEVSASVAISRAKVATPRGDKAPKVRKKSRVIDIDVRELPIRVKKSRAHVATSPVSDDNKDVPTKENEANSTEALLPSSTVKEKSIAESDETMVPVKGKEATVPGTHNNERVVMGGCKVAVPAIEKEARLEATPPQKTKQSASLVPAQKKKLSVGATSATPEKIKDVGDDAKTTKSAKDTQQKASESIDIEPTKESVASAEALPLSKTKPSVLAKCVQETERATTEKLAFEATPPTTVEMGATRSETKAQSAIAKRGKEKVQANVNEGTVDIPQKTKKCAKEIARDETDKKTVQSKEASVAAAPSMSSNQFEESAVMMQSESDAGGNPPVEAAKLQPAPPAAASLTPLHKSIVHSRNYNTPVPARDAMASNNPQVEAASLAGAVQMQAAPAAAGPLPLDKSIVHSYNYNTPVPEREATTGSNPQVAAPGVAQAVQMEAGAGLLPLDKVIVHDTNAKGKKIKVVGGARNSHKYTGNHAYAAELRLYVQEFIEGDRSTRNRIMARFLDKFEFLDPQGKLIEDEDRLRKKLYLGLGDVRKLPKLTPPTYGSSYDMVGNEDEIRAREEHDMASSPSKKRPASTITKDDTNRPLHLTHRLFASTFSTTKDETTQPRRGDETSPKRQKLVFEESKNNKNKHDDGQLGIRTVYRGSITHTVLEKMGRLNQGWVRNDPFDRSSGSESEGDAPEPLATTKAAVPVATATGMAKKPPTSSTFVMGASAANEKPKPARKTRVCFRPTVLPQRSAYTRKEQHRVAVVLGPHKGQTGFIVGEKDGIWSVIRSDRMDSKGLTFTVSNSQIDSFASAPGNPGAKARKKRRTSTSVPLQSAEAIFFECLEKQIIGSG